MIASWVEFKRIKTGNLVIYENGLESFNIDRIFFGVSCSSYSGSLLNLLLSATVSGIVV